MANPPALVLPDGRPFVRARLGEEMAAPAIGSIRSISSGHPAQGLNPARLGSLLRQAEEGDAIAYYELAEEMEEKDLHYASVLRTRKLAVGRLPIEVEPADDSAQAKDDAELIDTWLKRDMLKLELFDLCDAIGKGVSTIEILWDMKATSWLPRALKWRDPRWFEFDRIDGETLRLRGNSGPEDLPGGKFICHVHPSKSGLPVRSGLARLAAWGYMFKNFAIKDWVSFLEAFGQPLRIGKYGPNESEENKRILERALMSLGADAAAAFPETMSVEFVDRKGGTAPNDLWRSHAEYFDLQISKAVLGQTNTTDAQAGGLGSGQAEVHNEVREDIRDFDAALVAGTLNRDLVPVMVMLNRGARDAYPRIRIGNPDPIDAKGDIENAQALVSMGVKIDGEELRERSGLPAGKGTDTDLKAPGQNSPQEGAEVVPGGSAAKTLPTNLLDRLKIDPEGKAPEGKELNSQQSEREPDFVDRTTDEALDDWEPMIEPMLSPIDELVGECRDMAELQSRLAETISAMETGAFEQAMARGLFAARVKGLAEPSSTSGREA